MCNYCCMNRVQQMVLLGRLAADQWGLITTAQAKSLGLNAVQLKRLADAELLESVGRGVYLVTGNGMPEHVDIKVAWLRLRPEVAAWERKPEDPDSGVVSHASACLLQDLGDIPAGEVEITVPRRRTTREPFVRLHIAPIAPADVVIVDGLPVTNATRTIVDLLRRRADGGHIGGVITDAERRDLLSVDALAERVGEFVRPYGLPPTADGRSLIEYLAAQSGENLRSQEIERAAQEGVVVGAVLQSLSPYRGTLPSNAVQETIRQLQASLPSNAVQEMLRQYRATLPSNAVQQAIPGTVDLPVVESHAEDDDE